MGEGGTSGEARLLDLEHAVHRERAAEPRDGPQGERAAEMEKVKHGGSGTKATYSNDGGRAARAHEAPQRQRAAQVQEVQHRDRRTIARLRKYRKHGAESAEIAYRAAGTEIG